MKPFCAFCNPGAGRAILLENDLAFAIYDKYPVTEGHVLVVTRRCAPQYFDLTANEKSACWELVDEVKKMLEGKFNPDGFNIGINCGEAAGQTVMHVHIHIIPRYRGDVENPRGGVRGVIPGRRDY